METWVAFYAIGVITLKNKMAESANVRIRLAGAFAKFQTAPLHRRRAKVDRASITTPYRKDTIIFFHNVRRRMAP